MNFDDEVKRLKFYLKDCEEENRRLREKVERYEKALKEIAEFGGTDMIEKSCANLAKETLQ